MAKASRMQPILDGRPRGLLAHEDFGKSKNSFLGHPKRSLRIAANSAMVPSNATKITRDGSVGTPRSNSNERGHFSLTHLGMDSKYDTQQAENEVSAFGRYASHRKPRMYKGRVDQN